MPYFTKEIKIPDYNWTVKIYEPSIGELDALEVAYRANDFKKAAEAWVPLVKEWDVTDRQEKILDITAENIAALPVFVLRHLMTEVEAFVTRKEGDPKATSAASPILPPARGEAA